MSVGEGLKLGAKAGLIGGLLVVIVGTPLTYLAAPAIETRVREAGVNLPADGVLLILLVMLILAAINFVLTIIGGVVAAPIFGRRVGVSA